MLPWFFRVDFLSCVSVLITAFLLQVLVTMEGSPDYDSVLVGDEGFVQSYAPRRHNGDHQTIVFVSENLYIFLCLYIH